MKVLAKLWRRLANLLPPGPGDDWAPLPDDEWPEWRRRWAAMPHRRLDAPACVAWGAPRSWGEPVAATIALVPPEYAGRVHFGSRRCPVCGRRAVGPDRRAAHLSTRWANGLTIGFGAWVHPACFDGLPDAGTPAPVPW